MKAKAVLVAILFVTAILTAALGEAIVTLKSGEVLQGDIVSDTNDVMQIRALSVNRTISSLRNVPHADIQNVYNETPAEAAERIDYFALSKFQLNPDQEQSTDFYTQWIAAFEKFLTDYPKSDKTHIVKQHIEACQAELKHVIAGEAKFENKWMTPAEKRPLSLNKQLADLEKQRASLAKTVAAAQEKLDGLQARLRTLPKNITREVAHDATTNDEHHYGYKWYTTETVPNPEFKRSADEIYNCQQQVASGGQALANLDAKIQGVKIKIPQARQEYEIALAKVAEAERLAYEAVQKYRLNPDQEFTALKCAVGLAVCQKYLETYPSGEYAAAVRQQSVELQQEKEQVEKGLVKFGNRWMSASQKAAVQELEAQLQAERNRQALAEREKEAQLQAERDRQALVEQERALAKQEKEAQHQRMMNLLSELGQIIVSTIVLLLLVGGFAVSLRFGARLAKIENVASRTAWLASVTALVALIVIFLCCVPLWRYALIMALVLGTVATSFTVKSIFRATWEQALLTNMFALAATTVGMTLLILLLHFLDISCSILDLVERHVPSIL